MSRMTYREWLIKERQELKPRVGDKIIIIAPKDSILDDDDIRRLNNMTENLKDKDKAFDCYFKNCYVEQDGNSKENN
jgi:hypothetical protein